MVNIYWPLFAVSLRKASQAICRDHASYIDQCHVREMCSDVPPLILSLRWHLSEKADGLHQTSMVLSYSSSRCLLHNRISLEAPPIVFLATKIKERFYMWMRSIHVLLACLPYLAIWFLHKHLLSTHHGPDSQIGIRNIYQLLNISLSMLLKYR